MCPYMTYLPTFVVRASFVREYRKIPNDGVVASFYFFFFVK